MAKKLKAVVRLQLVAGKANPAPPVGPALAGHGIMAPVLGETETLEAALIALAAAIK